MAFTSARAGFDDVDAVADTTPGNPPASPDTLFQAGTEAGSWQNNQGRTARGVTISNPTSGNLRVHVAGVHTISGGTDEYAYIPAGESASFINGDPSGSMGGLITLVKAFWHETAAPTPKGVAFSVSVE